MLDRKELFTVLVVEDDPGDRVFYHFILSEHQYRLLWAEDGEQAIDLLQREQVDVVLLDLFLPRMDGLEVCRWLQTHQDYRDLPVVVVSARGEKEDVYKLYTMGYTYYFDKPVHPRTLVNQINNLIRRRILSNRSSSKPN